METEGGTIAVMAVATDTALFTEAEQHTLRVQRPRAGALARPALVSARKPDGVLASAERR